jgi:hypothetical protein
MLDVLCALVVAVPVGTNLALVHVLWTVVSGRLLVQRGALVPALWASGLSAAAVLQTLEAQVAPLLAS